MRANNKKITKQVNQLTTQVARVSQLENKLASAITQVNDLRKANNLPRDPMEYRKMPSEEVVPALEDYHRIMRSQYLYSMIHPDYAVTEGLQVKMYSDVPVPTTSIGIRCMYNTMTSKEGTFLATWTPNFLSSQAAMTDKFKDIQVPSGSSGTGKWEQYYYSNLSYCNSEFLVGDNEYNSNRSYPLPSFQPSVLLQKYRLVSAIMKVKYNGSVLNQSGTMVSCATFDAIPAVEFVMEGNTADSVSENLNYGGEVARYQDFNLIRNGLWNYSQNITADANGIECLYVPLDPMSNTFYDLGTYYGAPDDISNGLVADGAAKTAYAINRMVGAVGAQLSYVVAGYNLPASTKCIQIEVFYNFEVISDPSVAPLLRSSLTNHFDWADKRKMDALFRELSRSGLIRRVWDRVKAGFPSFAKATLTWGPRLLPIISKFI